MQDNGTGGSVPRWWAATAAVVLRALVAAIAARALVAAGAGIVICVGGFCVGGCGLVIADGLDRVVVNNGRRRGNAGEGECLRPPGHVECGVHGGRGHRRAGEDRT